MIISVIVPVYKGKKYIKQIIKQIEECKKRIDEMVELLLINDCPEEKLATAESDIITVRVFNSDTNRGIQGARIYGCELSSGEYILMLDQDDLIEPEYLKSQLENIKKYSADASICRARECGRCVYCDSNPFDKVIDLEHMTGVGNAIVSPGQVLLRKNVVSSIWKNNILKNNGADDWLLWLCMLGEHKQFVLNEEVLFEHVVNGSNASWNSERMLLSEREVYEVIKNSKLYEISILNRMERLIETEQFRYIHLLEKFRRMFMVYDNWMRLECEKGPLSGFLQREGYKRIAVYGVGYIGMQLWRRLNNTEVHMVSLIDLNAEYIESEFPIVKLEEFQEKVDLIVVTQVENTEDIISYVKGMVKAPVISIQKLLDNWGQG